MLLAKEHENPASVYSPETKNKLFNLKVDYVKIPNGPLS